MPKVYYMKKKRLTIKQTEKLKQYFIDKHNELIPYGYYTLALEELQSLLFPPKLFSYLNAKGKK